MAGWDRPEGRLVLQFADDHHAFHEDAKPGDLAGHPCFSSSKPELATRQARHPPSIFSDSFHLSP